MNGSRFCEFAARDDLSQVSSLYVDGDIQMSSLSVVSLGGGREPVPTDVGGGGGGKGPREAGEADGAGESHPAVVTHPEPHPHEPEPQPQPAHHPHPQPPVSVPGPQGKLVFFSSNLILIYRQFFFSNSRFLTKRHCTNWLPPIGWFLFN